MDIQPLNPQPDQAPSTESPMPPVNVVVSADMAPPMPPMPNMPNMPAAPAPAFSLHSQTPPPMSAAPQPAFTEPIAQLPAASDLVSQPVVRVLSPRGIEYVFLTIALFTAAIGLGSALISLVNGQTGFDILAFPVASLLVSVPVFGLLFLRLKKSEANNPSLRYEASKRRSTQFSQIAGFVTCFFTLIGFVTSLFAKAAGEYHGSVGKLFLDVLIVLIIAGGILAYYWRDEHRV